MMMMMMIDNTFLLIFPPTFLPVQDSTERLEMQKALDLAPAYAHCLPRSVAAVISKSRRFRDDGDDWQKQERYRPR